MKANAGVANGDSGALEVYHVCVGFVTLDLAAYDDGATEPTAATLTIQGGNIAAPLKLRPADVPQRGAMMGWYTPLSELTVEISTVDERSPIGTWVHRLPCMGCVPQYVVPLLVLYRTMMAEKLWQAPALPPARPNPRTSLLTRCLRSSIRTRRASIGASWTPPTTHASSGSRR